MGGEATGLEECFRFMMRTLMMMVTICWCSWLVWCNGGSRCWDKWGGRSPNIFFDPSGLFLVENKGGPGPPGPVPWIRHCDDDDDDDHSQDENVDDDEWEWRWPWKNWRVSNEIITAVAHDLRTTFLNTKELDYLFTEEENYIQCIWIVEMK